MNLWDWLQLFSICIFLPIFSPVLISWLLIRKGHPIIGMMISPIPIILFMIAYREYYIYQTQELYRTGAPHPGITGEGYAFQILFGLLCGAFDGFITLISSVIIALIYRRKFVTSQQIIGTQA